jgi:hypothetical protein
MINESFETQGLPAYQGATSRDGNQNGNVMAEIKSELHTITLRDKALGIKEGELIDGVSLGTQASQWRFLEENLNFIEVGSSYHSEFIARVEVDYNVTYFALIAWRPAFGKSQDYLRLAKLRHRPLEPIRLDNKVGNYFGFTTADLVEFVSRVTFEIGQVSFKIPIASIKVLRCKTQEEVGSSAT